MSDNLVMSKEKKKTAAIYGISSPQQMILFIIIALLGAFFLVYGIVEQPGFTDAFYHMNAANRLVRGDGFTDPYLWTYIGAPDELPAPSHLYWMPMTSLTAAAGMWLFNAPESYQAAQIFLMLMVSATAIFTYWLGLKLGKSTRHAWVAGLMTLAGGFFSRYWGATDTFAPYAFFGAFCLGFMGLAMTADNRRWLWWLLAGAFAGFGHLTRADGLLLLLVAWSVICYPFDFIRRGNVVALLRQRLLWLILVTLGYLLVMTPWFLRNFDVIGTALPVGGTQSIWFTAYNDLFSFPPDASPENLFADGLGTLIQSRWSALTNNFGTLIGVEGFVVLMPFMLIGLWGQRKHDFLRAFWIYALGLHLAMTFVFAYPGFRGGLFHSVSALLPFWSVLAVIGLDAVVDWIAAHRRRWKPTTAKRIFSIAMVLLVFWLSFTIGWGNRVRRGTPTLYTQLAEMLPADSRLMINDPAMLYYFTGFGGVVVPNESVETVPTIAQIYGIDYLLIEGVTAEGIIRAAPHAFAFDPDDPPEFLIPVPPYNEGRIRLYEISD